MNKKSNLAILFFTMAVSMLGFGIVIPIIPFYIQNMGAKGGDLGMLIAVFSFAQFIFAPVWGSLSDRIGRKPVLIIGALGNALSQILMGFATTMGMMFASRLLAGILSAATLPVAMAFISDSTDEKERGGGMGIIGAAMGIGMILGPGVGGAMAGKNLSLPFFLAGGLSLIAVVLIMIILPESLPVSARVNAKLKTVGPQLMDMGKALFGPLGFIFFLSFLVNFALAAFEGVFGMFAAIRYEYGPDKVGLIMMVIGVISTVIQGVLTGPATKRWGENAIIKVSLIASAVGFVLMLAAVNMGTILLTVGFFVTANAMLRPSISSIISKETTTGQGAAMGLNNSFMSMGRIVGPMLAGWLFDINISFPYIASGVLLLITFILSMILLRKKPVKIEPVIQAQSVPGEGS